jgi:hypothetical protein
MRFVDGVFLFYFDKLCRWRLINMVRKIMLLNMGIYYYYYYSN